MFTLIFECTKMINLKPLSIMVNLFLEPVQAFWHEKHLNSKNHVNWMPIVKQYAHKSKHKHKIFSFLHLRSQISVQNSLLFQISTIVFSPIFKYVLIYIYNTVKIMLLCSFVACNFFVNRPFWHGCSVVPRPLTVTLHSISSSSQLISYWPWTQHKRF